MSSSFCCLSRRISSSGVEAVFFSIPVFLDIKPEPNWLLIDEASNLTYEKASNVNQKFKFLQDSIQRIQVQPTGEEKTVLGIRAKEYKTETEEYDYTFWLGDFNGITASPVYFQFKDLIVLELKIIFKDVLGNGNKREISYQLKDKKEATFNFKKNKLVIYGY